MNSIDLKKAKLQTTCEIPGISYAICRDAEGDVLYVGGADWSVYRVDPNAEKPVAEKKWTSHSNYISCLGCAHGVVLTGGYDGRLIWTDATCGESIRSIEAHQGWVRDLALIGDKIATVGDDMLVKVWNWDTGELIRTMDGHAKKTPQGFATALYAVAATSDGKHIASGDRIGEVRVWNVESGKLAHQFKVPAFYTYDPVKRSRSIGGIRSLCFSPDDRQLAIGGIGQVTNVDGFVGPCRVEIWDWQAAKSTHTAQDKHKAVLNHVAYHPTQERLVIGAGGGDSGGILAFFDHEKAAPIHKAKPKGHLQQVCFNETGTKMYVAGFGGVQIWSLTDDSADGNKSEDKNASSQ